MKHTIAVMLTLSLMAGISGCATSSAGRFERRADVVKSFMSYEVLPGYRYYTVGPGEAPDAIIGIKSEYTLRSELWKERSMTSELLMQYVTRMNYLFSAEAAGLIGAAILDEQGEQVGVWYSAAGATQVYEVSDTEVAVDPPDPIVIEQEKKKFN